MHLYYLNGFSSGFLISSRGNLETVALSLLGFDYCSNVSFFFQIDRAMCGSSGVQDTLFSGVLT